jgi:hypothetical protein
MNTLLHAMIALDARCINTNVSNGEVVLGVELWIPGAEYWAETTIEFESYEVPDQRELNSILENVFDRSVTYSFGGIWTALNARSTEFSINACSWEESAFPE